ncbi:MAG: PhzF family phenazine biosynthesis protein, partial [Myxococcales bacterium]|nr:PhzF family phenazine biosynthesis protein [Myxococcales bacterium]
MPRFAFRLVNVFAENVLEGNPLCVFEDARGLDDGVMQALALQMNLSETTFLFPAEAPHATAKVRIFTPTFEMPFAGHPTVGTAVALSELGMSAANDNNDTDASIIILDEPIGSVRCLVSKDARGSFAEFDLPKL